MKTLWISTKDRLPPENVNVDTKIDDGNTARNIQALTYHSGHWWHAPDMYVYYQPTHWRPLEPCVRQDAFYP